jgi:hypothetical protein
LRPGMGRPSFRARRGSCCPGGVPSNIARSSSASAIRMMLPGQRKTWLGDRAGCPLRPRPRLSCLPCLLHAHSWTPKETSSPRKRPPHLLCRMGVSVSTSLRWNLQTSKHTAANRDWFTVCRTMNSHSFAAFLCLRLLRRDARTCLLAVADLLAWRGNATC